jgi:protease-4
VKIGLADRLGNFQDAVNAAAKKAGLKDFRVVEYPDKIAPLNQFLSNTEDKVRVYFAKEELGDNYMIYQQMKKAILNSGLQARLPYEIRVN